MPEQRKVTEKEGNNENSPQTVREIGFGKKKKKRQKAGNSCPTKTNLKRFGYGKEKESRRKDVGRAGWIFFPNRNQHNTGGGKRKGPNATGQPETNSAPIPRSGRRGEQAGKKGG